MLSLATWNLYVHIENTVVIGMYKKKIWSDKHVFVIGNVETRGTGGVTAPPQYFAGIYSYQRLISN